jgi:hypothetical protein
MALFMQIAVCVDVRRLLVCASAGCALFLHTANTAALQKPVLEARSVSRQERADAIGRAHVWRAPKVPIARARLIGDLKAPSQLDCRFLVAPLGGTTPKFDCLLPSGKKLRTKYGHVPEIPAEVAATRLLSALGFGADQVTLVERVRCYGCPLDPFRTTKVVDTTHAQTQYERSINYQRFTDFDWVAVEERLASRPIEAEGHEGWGFFELDLVNSAIGGAPRAHVDALRLLAVFLAHWDNKAENQRLVCLSPTWTKGKPCPEPFLMLQDLGATFGPRKVDLDGWERAAIWKDRPTCTVSMDDLPHGGGTFAPTRISEKGRQFLTELLRQLTDTQVEGLFSAARFDKQNGLLSGAAPVSEWVRVFKRRVRDLSDGPACPS